MDKNIQDNNQYVLVNTNNNNNCNRDITMQKTNQIKQYLAASAGNLGAVSCGIALAWTSPSLQKLEGENWEEDSPLSSKLTPEQSSWVGSLIAVGAMFGPFLAGYLSEKIGRKTVLLSTAIPLIIGWILMATTHTVGQIYAARVLWGISVGALFAVLPVYVGEISEDNIRGALGSFLQLFLTFGFLYTYVIGPYISWTWLCVASIVVPIIFAIVFFFMPESPYYYLAKNRNNDAAKALMYLRDGTREEIQVELNEMKENVDKQMQSKGGFRDLFATRGTKKAILISLSLVMFQQFSGINVVLFYAETIFDATGSSLSASISTIIIGIVQCLASGVTPLVADRLGRRILLLTSGIGMALMLFLLGLYFNLVRNKYDVSSISFLPVLSLVGYMIVYCTGFGPLPWAVMAELLPNNVKSVGSTATASFCWFLGFLITKFFSTISEEIGMDFAFWIFTIFCVFAVIFVYFILPETKGKSLQEITNLLEGR